MKAALLYRIASVLLILFALGHTLGFRRVDPRWGVDSIIGALRSTHFDVQGLNRTYWDFYIGFGLFVTSPSGLRRSAIVATRKLAQGVLIGDAGRHMGPRGVLRPRHVLELEILLRGADDLFRHHYHLLCLRGMDRWKAVSNAPTAIGHARKIGTCRFFVKAT